MGELFSVEGKTAVVTGGSRGIGLMIARGLVEGGARVYVSSRKAEACRQVAEELSRAGECLALPADLSTEEGCRRLAAEVGERQFTAMLEYKAALYGRQVVKVDPWYPSSQVCSACGHRAGPKPLKVRSWTCPGCGVAHDRDLNASKNILGPGWPLPPVESV